MPKVNIFASDFVKKEKMEIEEEEVDTFAPMKD